MALVAVILGIAGAAALIWREFSPSTPVGADRAWQDVKNSEDPCVIDAFRQRYIDQLPYVRLADEALGKLGACELAKAAAIPTPTEPKSIRDCQDCPELMALELEASGEDNSTKRVAVSRYETTVGQYRAFILATNHASSVGCATGGAGKDARWDNPGFTQTDSHPVVCVSSADARAYTRWLSEKSGRHYTLLTFETYKYLRRVELEEDGKSTCATENIPGTCANKADRFEETAPVGSFKSDKFGIFDLRGNVGELLAECAIPGPVGSVPLVDARSPKEDEVATHCGNILTTDPTWYAGDQTGLSSEYLITVSSVSSNWDTGFRVMRTN